MSGRVKRPKRVHVIEAARELSRVAASFARMCEENSDIGVMVQWYGSVQTAHLKLTQEWENARAMEGLAAPAVDGAEWEYDFLTAGKRYRVSKIGEDSYKVFLMVEGKHRVHWRNVTTTVAASFRNLIVGEACKRIEEATR